MTMRWMGVTLHIAAFAATLASNAGAQKTTERFIPIGQSPGVSGVTSIIGPVESIDARASTCQVRTSSGPVTVRITEATSIWLDRSAQRQTALDGDPDDIAIGRTVEVKFVDPDRREIAEWIKVAVPGG
ncbi:MAG: hypothetical protein L0271_20165 [Gemmatimonadetes bacterium]|nr:hypothetical protein [Gemmatimonadota bacterium]